MALPLHKFCDLVYAAVMEGRDENERAKLHYEMEKVRTRKREREVELTESDHDRELQEMMAISANMGK